MAPKKTGKYYGKFALIAEDDNAIRRDLKDFLEMQGIAVCECYNAYCARQRIVDNEYYDILFTDMSMKTGNVGGEQVIEASRQFKPGKPIVVISETGGYSLGEKDEKYKQGIFIKIPIADKQLTKRKMGDGRKTLPRGVEILKCLEELLK
jgi:DNA-binding NtrC family response regulator